MPEDKLNVEEPKPKRRGRKPKAKSNVEEPKPKRTYTKKVATERKVDYKNDGREKIFALDIGTRSVIGIVAEQEDNGQLSIIATHRKEHTTRAMLDGQIHDVPKVAAVIEQVRDDLTQEVGELKSVAVAAAGRALYTMTAVAEMEVRGVITAEQQSSLDFMGVQLAQSQLSEEQTITDQNSYYCVGFSVINYELDGIRLKSLVGQRGKLAKVKVIATFLPRQVIDSMQSALTYSKLEMSALTLEPIAAINVLIPQTMRHLNLVLVDIGAGTSDVAITKNGSVVAYGMVPVAGDEITEALSQKFLLDFNVAEEIKRKAANGESAQFPDILGGIHNMTAAEIIDAITENISNLAREISKTVLELNNGEIPQAVMLVGGGALTPNLQKHVAEAMNMPPLRVGVRRPDVIDGIIKIPEDLCKPDAVTPLGILKIASIKTLHFLTVYINEDEYTLFHFQDLTIRDALLNAGVNLRRWNGKPGLGLVITVDGEKKSFPGSMGKVAKLKLNGEDATLDTLISNKCHIKIERGDNGESPVIRLGDVVSAGQTLTVKINDAEEIINSKITVNDELGIPNRILKDGDVVKVILPHTIGEVLRMAGYPPTGQVINYTINGRESHYTCSPKILMDDSEVQTSLPIHDGDAIEYIPNDNLKVSDVLNISGLNSSVTILYEGESYDVPVAANINLVVNERPATMNTIIDDGAVISYRRTERKVATVSDALLAVNFQPPPPSSRMSFIIKVNDNPADFTTPMTNGDKLEIILKTPDGEIVNSLNSVEIPIGKFGTPQEQTNRRKLTIQDFIRND